MLDIKVAHKTEQILPNLVGNPKDKTVKQSGTYDINSYDGHSISCG